MKIMSNKKYNSLTNYIVQCDEERKILKAHNRELEKQLKHIENYLDEYKKLIHKTILDIKDGEEIPFDEDFTAEVDLNDM
ncbi:hypothetical protein [Anaerofustis stercorihominis]|uniref:Uncharacterized protein n=1 Tax=Anaerofustis stercorihominis TaxID=214853 RepID=A0A3E3DX66_9FIRM|nr:hypothetical protein [Anaerofustis stercorihominis]RGD73844.1 hypothetical protein DW687_08700 [Anaerofustis stercorihominis]